jgi:hypothetical protein
MSSRKYTWNAFETTLDGALSAGATSIALTSATNLRSPGYLVLEPDDAAKREYISFTGISTNTLTGVTRGLAGGQSGTAHDSGKKVRAVIFHQFIDDIFTDIEALETADAGHIGGTDTADHPEATGSVRGFMSAADKAKLDAISGTNTGDEDAASIRALGFFDITNDGAGSGLDADTLDGNQGAFYTPLTSFQGHDGGTDVADHPEATGSVRGFMSAADKAKLDLIEAQAKDDQVHTAGSGITITGEPDPTISHADTSSLASTTNPAGTVIEDVAVDGFGHLTGVTSRDLDSRYYSHEDDDTTNPYIRVISGSGPPTGGADGDIVLYY